MRTRWCTRFPSFSPRAWTAISSRSVILAPIPSSVVDPNRFCSDPDPGSHVRSDPAPDPNRIRINSDLDPAIIVQIF